MHGNMGVRALTAVVGLGLYFLYILYWHNSIYYNTLAYKYRFGDLMQQELEQESLASILNNGTPAV